jgi:hypothetical protein
MSITHRKLKPVEQNVGDQALHVYHTPETETSRIECRSLGDHALHVYHTPETETGRSECRRPGTSCLLYTRK